MSPVRDYCLSVQGFLVAGLSGAFVAFGSGLLEESMSSPKKKEDNDMLQRRALGGALFVAGLYTFSPAFLRAMWRM